MQIVGVIAFFILTMFIANYIFRYAIYIKRIELIEKLIKKGISKEDIKNLID